MTPEQKMRRKMIKQAEKISRDQKIIEQNKDERKDKINARCGKQAIRIYSQVVKHGDSFYVLIPAKARENVLLIDGDFVVIDIQSVL